ncbi:response regulator transcription factor [Caldimonas brevitalea]|uniref:LuxR family transcriptional regulator n=1 Tax=Caldimonas brevitalea TaxID=413882 RepID=A0A0G3BNC6_9BURK|nr:response regulator transcription factor [Caldimonas brevitalea]AKJ29493.1 LuxR family transcriptional regulator [Caldimonas brevitalea]
MTELLPMPMPLPLQTGVLIADDHRIVREGLKRILSAAAELHVVAEADTGHRALEALGEHKVDVAIVDLSMPGVSGMELIRRIRVEHPEVAVLVFTMHAEEQYAMRAFRAGAHGYLTKDSATEELVPAVRKVAGGGGYVSPGMAERLAMQLNGLRQAPPHTVLTDREFEVFRMIVEGKRLTEIAQALHLSVKTVSTHKSRILDKMGLDSGAALIKYGLQHHLFDDADPPD